MDIFVSPMATVIAKTVAFISGSVLAVLVLLTVWDEDVLNVEHVSREISNKIFEDILPLLGVSGFLNGVSCVTFSKKIS